MAKKIPWVPERAICEYAIYQESLTRLYSFPAASSVSRRFSSFEIAELVAMFPQSLKQSPVLSPAAAAAKKVKHKRKIT